METPGKDQSVRVRPARLSRPAAFDAAAHPLPDAFTAEDRAAWADWCADHRARRKAITARGAEGQLAELLTWAGEGYPPAFVLRYAIAKGWQGLYRPKEPPPLAASEAGLAPGAAIRGQGGQGGPARAAYGSLGQAGRSTADAGAAWLSRVA